VGVEGESGEVKPRCYNREPFEGYWAPAGCIRGKRVLRWIPHRMSQPCKSWSTGDRALPVPVLQGWNCNGCRWMPREEIERVMLVMRADVEALGMAA
jgi:hypothetical protein